MEITDPLARPSSSKMEVVKRGRTLRPPTLMIDLLFGALMLFAFQMGYVDKAAVPYDVEVPSAEKGKKDTRHIYKLLPLRGENGKWQFQVSGGDVLTPVQVKKTLLKNRKTPVLIFSGITDLQTYIEASDVLRRHGLKPALHVQTKEGSK